VFAMAEGVPTPWLNEPWGSTTSTARWLVSLVVFLYVSVEALSLSSVGPEFQLMFSAPQLSIVQQTLGLCGACTLASIILFIWGGGCRRLSELIQLRTASVVALIILHLLFMLCLSTSVDRTEADVRCAILVFVVLLMPVLALCFERERDGRVRQYGMWPCLMGGKATMPHLGVFPGLLLIVAMALITLLHDPSYVEALGVFLTIGGMCVFAAETLAVATMLASDTDPFASVGVCAVVALPALAVIGLILIFSDEATALREYIDQDAARAALVLLFCLFTHGARLVLRFLVIHLTSPLTSMIAYVAALVIQRFYLSVYLQIDFRWYNITALALFPLAIVVHVWYMFQRQQVMATNALQPNEHQPLTQQKKEPLPAA